MFVQKYKVLKRKMNTITLCRFACSDVRIRNTFGGVYASDRLPKFKRKFSTFIANLDPHTLPGSHWVAIFFSIKKPTILIATDSHHQIRKYYIF